MPSPDQTNTERALILVVERDPHVRELERYFLEQAGFAVEFCGDGVVGLERARLLRPAIIVTEILLARLDGLSVCRALRGAPETRDIPILVFSILVAEERAIEAGANLFLRKPVNERRLIEAVESLLHRRQA